MLDSDHAKRLKFGSLITEIWMRKKYVVPLFFVGDTKRVTCASLILFNRGITTLDMYTYFEPKLTGKRLEEI